MFLDVDIVSGKIIKINMECLFIFYLIAVVNVFNEQLNLIVDVQNAK